jgi:hypothetical protein
MTLRDLENKIARLRASGAHPLTPVVLQDVAHTQIPLDEVIEDAGRIVIQPSWLAAQEENE